MPCNSFFVPFSTHVSKFQLFCVSPDRDLTGTKAGAVTDLSAFGTISVPLFLCLFHCRIYVLLKSFDAAVLV